MYVTYMYIHNLSTRPSYENPCQHVGKINQKINPGATIYTCRKLQRPNRRVPSPTVHYSTENCGQKLQTACSKDTIFWSGKEATFPDTVAASGKQEYTDAGKKFDSCILFRFRCDRQQRRRGDQGQGLQRCWRPEPGTCTMARSNFHKCFDASSTFATI